MRLTLNLCGWTWDWSIEPTASDDQADDGSALNGGTLASYPIGYNAWPVPEEIPIQPHVPAWDEPDDRGQR